MIDEPMLNRESGVPRVSIVINQITSSQFVRAYLVVVTSTLMLYLIVVGSPIPDAIIALFFTVMGYYFGEAAPRPEKK